MMLCVLLSKFCRHVYLNFHFFHISDNLLAPTPLQTSLEPTLQPTIIETPQPTTLFPTFSPSSMFPTFSPSLIDTLDPTLTPTNSPTPLSDIAIPTYTPTTLFPTFAPSDSPTIAEEEETAEPSLVPTLPPVSTNEPTIITDSPTDVPTSLPTSSLSTIMPSLMPSEQALKTIVDFVSENDDFSTLTAAVDAADLIDTLSSDGPFTLFGKCFYFVWNATLSTSHLYHVILTITVTNMGCSSNK